VDLMKQTAPYPVELRNLVENCRYRPGWEVRLEDDLDRDEVDGEVVGRGMTLVITTLGYNSYHPERDQTYRVNHYFIVPAATYNRQSWQRWLFEQFVLVETHEAMEFFVIAQPAVVEVDSECQECGHFATRHDGRDSTCHACPADDPGHRFVQDPADVDLVHPYSPNHGPGHSPYTVRELTTLEARNTSFRGIVKS
jgi:hypothetical protein